ncbi:MAG: HAMP domain-containing histidine kinase [Actinomycetota bacterium]|nr:HAMP domain-containing histidine kinase [Actinomycetota bacterium]
MKPDPTVRRTSRQLGWQTAAVVVGVLVVMAIGLLGFYGSSAHRADQRLLVNTTAHVDEPNEAPPGVLVSIASRRGIASSSGLPKGLLDRAAIDAVRRDGVARESTIKLANGTYRMRTASVGSLVVQAVLDQHERQEEQGRVVTSLLLAGGIAVVLAGLAAAWLGRRSVRPLGEALAMQRRFVADASHELRTPLTLLSTRAQMVSRQAQDGAADPTDLQAVVADARALGEILEDLLATVDTRTMRSPEAVELPGLVAECIEAAHDHAVRLGISLTSTIAADVPAVSGSRAGLRRALTSLIDNAVDHAEKAVEVDVRRRGRRVAIAVRDDGPGIPDQDAPHLFDRFATRRAVSAAVTPHRHYGLGLALVADVAAMHGGQVRAHNREDGHRGAVLVVELPVPRR